MAERVELAQVISQLRQELSAAMREGEGEDLRFELGPVELELTVAVSKEAGPNAKVRFWVVELGADAKVASQATQRITLTLDSPPPRGGGQAGDLRVGAGRRALESASSPTLLRPSSQGFSQMVTVRATTTENSWVRRRRRCRPRPPTG